MQDPGWASPAEADEHAAFHKGEEVWGAPVTESPAYARTSGQGLSAEGPWHQCFISRAAQLDTYGCECWSPDAFYGCVETEAHKQHGGRCLVGYHHIEKCRQAIVLPPTSWN